MVSTQKQSLVANLQKLLEDHQSFALISFGKTTHQSLEKLRHELKKENSHIKIVKNSLFEKTINILGLKNKQFKDLKKQFFPITGDSALLTFGTDWSRGLKAFYTFSQNEKNLQFKLALIDATIYGAADAEKIAKLPGRNELVAGLLGSMKNPVTKTIYAMKNSMQKFVYILAEKSKKG